jgi:hypothetical protein
MRNFVRGSERVAPILANYPGRHVMYTYLCCRCTKCAARIVLEEWAESIYLLHRPVRPRPRHQRCPFCESAFAPERYYVTESGAPLAVSGCSIEMQDSSRSLSKTA